MNIEEELSLLRDRIETLEKLHQRERWRHKQSERTNIYVLAGIAAFLLVLGSGVSYESATGIRWALSPELLGVILGGGSILQGAIAVLQQKDEANE